jgi:hypothetical protein
VVHVCLCRVLLPCFPHYFTPYRCTFFIFITSSIAACYSCSCVVVVGVVAAPIVAVPRSALST